MRRSRGSAAPPSIRCAQRPSCPSAARDSALKPPASRARSRVSRQLSRGWPPARSCSASPVQTCLLRVASYAFFMLIDPLRSVNKDRYDPTLTGYLRELRSAPAQDGRKVMALDLQCATEADRPKNGIPVAPSLVSELRRIASSVSVAFYHPMPSSGRQPVSLQPLEIT